jgi:hypothetical protein
MGGRTMGRWGLILVTSIMAQIGYGQHEAA